MFIPFLQASKGIKKKSGQKSASAQQNDGAEAQAASAQPAGASSVSSGVKLENVRLQCTWLVPQPEVSGLAPRLGQWLHCATALLPAAMSAATPVNGAMLLCASQLHCLNMWPPS